MNALRRPAAFRSFTLGLWSLSLLAAGAAPAEDLDVRLALPILLKVLTYDAKFAAHASQDFRVVIVYEPAQEEAARSVLAAANQLALKTILGRTLQFVLTSSTGVAGDTESHPPNALLVLPGTTPEEVRALSGMAREHHWYTLSLSSDPVEHRELMLSVTINDGRPLVLIALDPAQQEGAVFEGSILKVAKLIQ